MAIKYRIKKEYWPSIDKIVFVIQSRFLFIWSDLIYDADDFRNVDGVSLNSLFFTAILGPEDDETYYRSFGFSDLGSAQKFIRLQQYRKQYEINKQKELEQEVARREKKAKENKPEYFYLD